MSARQQAGFDFEERFIKENKLIKNTDYIGRYDAYTETGIPIQIKSTASLGIGFGDAKRTLTHNENFILVVNYRKYKKTKIYYIDAKKFTNFLLLCNVDKRTDFLANALNQVSNDRCDDIKWKHFLKTEREIRKSYKNEGIDIQVQGKRDHKNQKRVQIAIGKIDEIYSNFEWQPEPTLIKTNFLLTV